MWKVQLFELDYEEEELNALKEVFDSKWITMGEKTRLFEYKFSEFLGSGVKSSAVSSGTAALHLALLALEVGNGDEVVVPGLTFIADLNVVYMVGAKPVLADCESLDNWNVSAKTIEKVITSKTKAVIIVHYAGYPCNMDEIVNLCKKYNISLIEDCAHSPGASYKGQLTGTFGDFGCFSFFTNKNLSVGEGGILTSRNEELFNRVRFLRSHGMTSLTLDRFSGRVISYDVAMPGLNYRIDEFRSALGLVQLKKLQNNNLKRKCLTEKYIEQLKNIDGITIPFTKLNKNIFQSSYHIMPILLDKKIDRKKIIEQLKVHGIQTSIHYPSFREFSFYKDKVNKCDIAEEISKRELTLPLHPVMNDDDINLVVDAIKKSL